MPRARKQPKIVEPQGFVASAAQVAAKQSRIKRAFQIEQWQTEAWGYFDTVGEFRYAQTWLAMAGSRAELMVERQQADGSWDEVPNGPAVEYLNEVLEGCGGKGQFLYTLLLHLGVPGESVIVGEDEVNNANVVVGYKWTVVEASELRQDGDGFELTDPDTGEKRKLGEGALLIRVWRPHPRDRAKADSAARAALPALREIIHIGKHISATVDSRLAGNGLLLLPKEVSLTRADGVTVSGNADSQDGKDPFMSTLVEAMTAPIADRDTAEAVVPVIARMPGEYIEKVQHLTFGTKFDEQAEPLREAAVKRLALGLDLPPEQLLGMADANHWSAWQVEEATVKTVIEPALQLICDAVTRQFLQPLMKIDAGDAAAVRYRVHYKTDKLILRPNRGQDAITLHGVGLVGDRTVREANGFDEGDEPTPAELQRMILIELARAGKIDPLTGTVLGLPPTATDKEKIPPAAPADVPPALEPSSATPQTTGQDVPDAGVPSQSALLAAAEPLVLRALERAGAKLRTRGDQARLANVPTHLTHLHLAVETGRITSLLAGAWTLVPTVAELNDVDAGHLTATLDTFTAGLLARREAYSRGQRQILAGRLAALATMQDVA